MTAAVIIALMSLVSARALIKDREVKELEAARLEEKIVQGRQKIALLQGLPQSRPIAIEQAYVDLNNDLNVLARTHRLSFALEVKGSGGADVAKAAVPSGLDGLKELEVHVVFSGLKHRGAILSLLDGLSAIEDALPVVIDRVHCEKNGLTADLSVIGPNGGVL
jgi:hypothetical protein